MACSCSGDSQETMQRVIRRHCNLISLMSAPSVHRSLSLQLYQSCVKLLLMQANISLSCCVAFRHEFAFIVRQLRPRSSELNRARCLTLWPCLCGLIIQDGNPEELNSFYRWFNAEHVKCAIVSSVGMLLKNVLTQITKKPLSAWTLT